MEVLGEIDAVEPLRQSCVFVPWPTTSMVERTPKRIDLLTLELQDIDLAACGPSPVLFIAREHPKSGPKPLPRRQLHPGFELAIGPIASPLAADSSRGIVTLGTENSGLPFVGFDDQMPLFDANVFGSVGVDLKFVVPPAKGVDLDFPFRKIQGIAVELIAPDGLPRIGLGHGSRCPKMQTEKRTKKESV